jgi:beta-mannanase
VTWGVLRGYLLSAVMVAVIFALLALQSLGPWAHGNPSAPAPWPVTHASGVAIGVTTVSLARNSFRAWQLADLTEVNAFEQHARLHADIVMWFTDWEHGTFDANQARAVAKRGSVPEISWEPWDSRVGLRRPQPKYTLKSIIDGRHDGYIRRFAEAVSRYGGSLRLRFAQEMNGTWYPWSESQNGNSRGQFVKAWRHVHAIFAAAGATNVTWIWSPVAGTIRAWEYPGSSQVDVVGLSGFNGGTILFAKRWRPFPAFFGPSLDAIHALAPGKPVALTEIASTEQGGDKATWIRTMFTEVRRRPYIRSLIWFNVLKETDWRIESSPEARAAFAEGAASLRDPVSRPSQMILR